MKNRKAIETKEIQEIMFEGLSRLSDFCEAHGIRCYLGFGTLLGALRYKDFIPWDDDIDVVVPREDYDRLLELTDEIEDKDWHLLSYKKVDGYYLPFMKFSHKHSVILPSRFSSGYLYGLSLDIFPMDSIPFSNYEKALAEAEKINRYYRKASKSYMPVSTLKPGVINFGKRQLKRAYFYAMKLIKGSVKDNVYQKIENKVAGVKMDPGYYSCHIFARNLALFPTSVFLGERTVMEFHGRDFLVPSGYHDFLRARYGEDYIVPPPVEQQKSEHVYTAYRI